MKIRTYIRIGKKKRGGYKIVASEKPSTAKVDSYPTVSFGLDFELPDDIFEQHKEVIAEVKVPAKKIKADVEPVSKGKQVMDKLKEKGNNDIEEQVIDILDDEDFLF